MTVFLSGSASYFFLFSHTLSIIVTIIHINIFRNIKCDNLSLINLLPIKMLLSFRVTMN